MAYTIEEQARRDRLQNAGIDPNTPAYVEKPGQTITAESLSPVSSLQLPERQQEPNYSAMIGAIPSGESIIAGTGQTTTAEDTSNEVSSRLLKAYEKLTNKKATIDPSTRQIASLQSQADAESQAGLPEFRKSLTDVNAQLQALQKE